MKQELSREEKLEKLERIVEAIKRDKKRGKKLFFVGDTTQAKCDYYRTEIGAKRANRSQRELLDSEGCFERMETVYPDIEEIDLGNFLDYLSRRNPMNPFMDLCHSSSAYPYKWLQDIEDLFVTNSDDKSKGWEDYLFPEDDRN